jgi:hypothetical protein
MMIVMMALSVGAEWEQRAALNCAQLRRTAPNCRQRHRRDLGLLCFGWLGEWVDGR